MMTTRKEHMKWCKTRALQYANTGDLKNAVLSMASDLTKHKDTDRPANGMLVLGAMQMVIDGDQTGVIKWINGFTE